MAHASARILSALLTTTFCLVPLAVCAQDEPAQAAVESGTVTPADEATKSEPATGEATDAAAASEAAAVKPADEASAPLTEEAAKPVEPAKPVEACKCDCPPPCPPPPPPPAPAPEKLVEWKAQSKGGLLITSGNAQSKNFSFGVNASRKEGKNKLTLEGGMAYGTSNATVATVTQPDPSSDPVITGIERQQVVSTNNWASKARYDRFLTDNNIAYASGQAAGDKVAGKIFFGGAQLGYSRQLLEDDYNLLVVEIGYDFSYESYVSQPDKVLDPVAIHSVRVLVGERLTLTKETGITASVETLLNLNKETKAKNAKDGSDGVKAFRDARVNAKVALTTSLWNNLSFGFGFTVKYDQNPAPLPVPKGAPAGSKFPAGWVDYAYADSLDTVTEATLIYTFF